MLTEQDKKALKRTIQANQHEVFILSIEEMGAIICSSPASSKPGVQQAWQKIKRKAEAGANYYASADDLRTLTKLVGDLGSFGAKAYVKTYGGKPHIILKGYPGLRKVLTGTKYGIKNPKVVTMGLGKAGAIHAAKQGGIISVVLLTTYRVVDYFLTDEATLSRLVGTLATDIVKVGIATGASIAAATIAGGITLAIGPIVVVVFIGIGVTLALDLLDKQYGITDQVIAGLDELGDDIGAYIESKKKNLQRTADEAVNSVIDYAVDSAQRIVVKFISDYLRKLLLPLPRVN